VLATEVVKRHVRPTSGAPFVLTPETVKEFHRMAFPGDPAGGQFRSVNVRASDSSHAPPAPDEIPSAGAAMCAFVNERLGPDHAIECAAFILWRLNWIHPFADGNGRTARTLSNC
jgi:Fic family protein